MIQCTELPENVCRSRKDCVFVNGLKRKYCRKKCVTRKNKSKFGNKNTQKNENCIETRNNNKNQIVMNNNNKKLIINEQDFILDPCKLLNKFNKYLNNNIFNFRDMDYSEKLKFTKMLPYIRKSGNDYKLNKKDFRMYNQIAEGSYGEVYKVSYDNTNTIVKIPKINEEEDKDKFIIESLIHNTLFCHFRGDFGDGARIPKIHFLANMVFKSKNNFVTGMDEVDMDGSTFLKTEKNRANQFDMMIQISKFLMRLQKNFQFMHKDLHKNNIMCKKLKNGKYRWYIIDFGLVSMNINGKYYHSTQDFPYEKEHNYNPSHDMRLLISSMYDGVLEKQKRNMKLTPFDYMIFKYGSIIKKYISKERIFFWGAYGDIVDIVDKVFLPENIYNVFMEANMNLKMGRIQRFLQDEFPLHIDSLSNSNSNSNSNTNSNTNSNSNSNNNNTNTNSNSNTNSKNDVFFDYNSNFFNVKNNNMKSNKSKNTHMKLKTRTKSKTKTKTNSKTRRNNFNKQIKNE